MTTTRPTTRRRFIIDIVLTAALVIVVLTGFAKSALDLIFNADQTADSIAFDWICVVVTLAVVVMAFIGYRRVAVSRASDDD